jgi:site-specific recombinase XerD
MRGLRAGAGRARREMHDPHDRLGSSALQLPDLTASEVDALLAAPDPKRWEGRRDKVMLALAVQTGLRVSELTSLNCDDITLGDGAAVRCEGKGRKQRTVPLDRPVQNLLGV